MTLVAPPETRPTSSPESRIPPPDSRRHRPLHLPAPPSDAEKYSYLGLQRRWPFVWLFIAQICLIYAFVRGHDPHPGHRAGVDLPHRDGAAGVREPVAARPASTGQPRRSRGLGRGVARRRAPSSRASTCSCRRAVRARACSTTPSPTSAALDWPGRSTCTYSMTRTAPTRSALADRCGLHYVVPAQPRRVEEGRQPDQRLRASPRRLHGGVRRRLRAAPGLPVGNRPVHGARRRPAIVQTAQYFDVDKRVN